MEECIPLPNFHLDVTCIQPTQSRVRNLHENFRSPVLEQVVELRQLAKQKDEENMQSMGGGEKKTNRKKDEQV